MIEDMDEFYEAVGTSIGATQKERHYIHSMVLSSVVPFNDEPRYINFLVYQLQRIKNSAVDYKLESIRISDHKDSNQDVYIRYYTNGSLAEVGWNGEDVLDPENPNVVEYNGHLVTHAQREKYVSDGREMLMVYKENHSEFQKDFD